MIIIFDLLLMKRLLLLTVICLYAGMLFAQNNANKLPVDTLTIGVKESPPFLMKTYNKWTGASIELWEKIAEDMNIHYVYKEYTLDELIHALGNSNVDLSINPLTVTGSRIEAFDFTQPFYISNLTVAAKKGDTGFIIAFLRNFFSTDFFTALLGLLVLIFIFGFIIWLIEKRKNPEMFASGWKGLADGFWWSAVTMTTVGYGDKAPVTPLGRVFGFIWMFTAIIVISGFTASIASSLTVNQLGNNIESMDDLRNVSVATVKGSSTDNFLTENNIDHMTFDKLDDAINALHNGQYKALVYDDAIMSYSIHHKNMSESIGILPLKFNKQYYSFAFPYDNKLRNTINQNLIETIESAYWQGILSKYNVDNK